jgi:drug/metabolite transporter (DMT)-like permease
MAIFVKLLINVIPAAEIIFSRCIISVLIIICMGALGKVSFKVKEKEKMIFRGIMGGTSILLYFYSIGMTSVSNAVLLSYTYPIFASIFSVMYLKEHLTKEKIAFILAAFTGIFMIFGIDFTSLNTGDLLALISGVTSGMAIVSIRELRKTESSWMIVFSFVLAGSIFSLFFLKGNIIMPDKYGIFVLFVIGIFGTIGQLLMTYAYKICSTALGGVISMSSVVITALLGMIIFKETLTLNVIFGGALIFISATFFSLKERYEIAK